MLKRHFGVLVIAGTITVLIYSFAHAADWHVGETACKDMIPPPQIGGSGADVFWKRRLACEAKFSIHAEWPAIEDCLPKTNTPAEAKQCMLSLPGGNNPAPPLNEWCRREALTGAPPILHCP